MIIRYQIEVGPDGKPRCIAKKGPKKFTPQFIIELFKKTIEWFSESPDNVFVREFILKEGYTPSSVFRAINSIKKSGDTSEEVDEMFNLYEMTRNIQEIKLSKGGLKEDFNPFLTKLMLTHHHKYKDGSENAAHGNLIFNQQINSGLLEGKSAEELARNYSAIVRGLQGSQSLQVSGPKEICADIE